MSVPDNLRVSCKVFIAAKDGSDHPAMGQGVADLLRGVVDTGSLNKSAKNLGMSYSKAWTLLGEVEKTLGVTLMERNGSHGSELSQQGVEMLALYDRINQQIREYAESLLESAR